MLRIGILLFWTLGVVSSVSAARAGFPLVRGGRPAPVCYVGGEQVVKTALAIYAADAERVAGEAPARCDAPGNAIVVVGSLSEPERLDPLLRAWGVSAKAVEGRWEAFRICEASRNGERALFVVGSDPRGTAYGVLELSRLLGAAPGR